MELSYWQSRWQKNNTGWHLDMVYPLLQQFWTDLSLSQDATVLVPLCGKSLDVSWIAEQGCRVIGIEASPKALREIMDRYPTAFTADSSYGFQRFRAENIELWQGDFLKLPATEIPAPDLIYDKAAIVALPETMRASYAQKILELCRDRTQIFLQTFEYNQQEMTGPPFSVLLEEIQTYFGPQFEIKLLHEQSKFNELEKFQQRGLSTFLSEKVYLLKPQ